ncbi:MAG: hypothetical protein P8X70_00625 [Nanoarchaeota archaeon]
MRIDYSNLTKEMVQKNFDIGYGQTIILNFQIDYNFKKGEFLREMKRKLKHYQITNYSENDKTANITLISNEKDLTEKGIGRKFANTIFSKIKELTKIHKGLELNQALFNSHINEIKRVYRN